MTNTTLTALFDRRSKADRAAALLVSDVGLAQSQVSVIAQQEDAAQPTEAGGGGLLASLKSMFMPDADNSRYSEAVQRGAFLLTAQVEESAADRAMEILEENGAVDLDDHERSWREAGWTGQTAQSAPEAAPEAPASISAPGDDRIEVGEEHLHVGKRLTQGGRVRVRSYVVETPVEERMTLRDEHVAVEHRSVDRATTADEQNMFADRVIEASESREEAVVSKVAHVTGEVVLTRTATDRPETVHDTLRRTEVEIEDDRVGADDHPSRSGTSEPAADSKPVDTRR